MLIEKLTRKLVYEVDILARRLLTGDDTTS